MKIIMFLVIFFLIGAFFIISNNSLALKESGNFQKFIDLYSAWFGKIFNNSGNVIGYVVKMDWLPN